MWRSEYLDSGTSTLTYDHGVPWVSPWMQVYGSETLTRAYWY